MVNGLAFPHTVETANPMGGMMTVETVSVEINPILDPVIFAKPGK
jgi:hypothetical protein